MVRNYKRMYSDEELSKLKSENFKRYYERDKEKIHAGRLKWFAEHPEYCRERCNHMLENGGNEARLKTQKDRIALREKAKDLGFRIDTRLNKEQMEKANRYFDYLKQKREELKKKSQ